MIVGLNITTVLLYSGICLTAKYLSNKDSFANFILHICTQLRIATINILVLEMQYVYSKIL